MKSFTKSLISLLALSNSIQATPTGDPGHHETDIIPKDLQGPIPIITSIQNGVLIVHEDPVYLNNSQGSEKCTSCVGHHGPCTIGEGNCHAPDTCGFCAPCHYWEARCVTPGECVCWQ
ncbi:hypothetical protein QBC35DRAFT_466729 [Podospora australis]|uniref:Uncharacterized protein n=1 Tax=Podospora australis TaxID=1536484 RepID=A0AAN7AD30_9PEZI|nr:hypothetical protein QBC35DRAFT_466729 [Podospora australis]